MPKKIKSQRSSFGTIKQLANGKWFGQITVGYDESGKQVRKSITKDSKEEVAIALMSLIANKDNNQFSENITIEKHMLYWLLHYKIGEVTSRTMNNLIRNAKLHIFPKFGKFHPKNVTSDALQEHFISLTKRMSFDTVKKIKQLLNQYYTYCVRQNIVKVNPVSNITIKKGDSNKKQVFVEKGLPKEYQEQFIKALDSDLMFKTICLTIMKSSERPQEIIALKWKDIDFENKKINIMNAVSYELEFDEEGNVIKKNHFEGKTKNGFMRRVPIEADTINLLTEWKRYREELGKSKNISMTQPNDYVFGTQDGERYTYYGLRCQFDKFLKRNGLGNSGIHLYNFRHTCCNDLFEGGTSPVVVQYVMGHYNLKTTMGYNTMKDGDVQLADLKRDNSKYEGSKDSKEEKIKKIEQLVDSKKLSMEDIEKIINAIEKDETEL